MKQIKVKANLIFGFGALVSILITGCDFSASGAAQSSQIPIALNAITSGMTKTDYFKSSFSQSAAEAQSKARAQQDCIKQYGPRSVLQGILFSNYSENGDSITRLYSCSYSHKPNHACLRKTDSNQQTSEFAAGTGVIADPYIICTPDQLVHIANRPAADFELGNSLDMTGINFVPLPAFSGNFDGKGYTIANLNITYGDGMGCGWMAYYGMFTMITTTGVVKDFTLLNPQATTLYGYVGFVAGISSGSIDKVSVIGGNLVARPILSGPEAGQQGASAGGIVNLFASGQISNVVVAHTQIGGFGTTDGIAVTMGMSTSGTDGLAVTYGPVSISNCLVYDTTISNGSGVVDSAANNSSGSFSIQNCAVLRTSLSFAKANNSGEVEGGIAGPIYNTTAMNNLSTAVVNNSVSDSSELSSTYTGGLFGTASGTADVNSNLAASGSVSSSQGQIGSIAGYGGSSNGNYFFASSGNPAYGSGSDPSSNAGLIPTLASLASQSTMPNLDWTQWNVYHAANCLDFGGSTGIYGGPVPNGAANLLAQFCTP